MAIASRSIEKTHNGSCNPGGELPADVSPTGEVKDIYVETTLAGSIHVGVFGDGPCDEACFCCEGLCCHRRYDEGRTRLFVVRAKVLRGGFDHEYQPADVCPMEVQAIPRCLVNRGMHRAFDLG